MKLILLVESSDSIFKQMTGLLQDKNATFIDTEFCDETREYQNLIGNIKSFSKSNKEVMLIKFSGRERVVSNLGGECCEMIIPMSTNKNSNYYTDKIIETFLDTIKTFEKGD